MESAHAHRFRTPPDSGGPLKQVRAANEAYLELFSADERARALGQPLLTDAGLSYLRQRLLPPRESCAAPAGRRAGIDAGRESGTLPHWDDGSRRLWLGGILLKEFRQPSPNQTRLLDGFQEQGWAFAHLDDPLPPAAGEGEEDAKRRLHDTIKNLNRGLPAGTIRFRGDGTGQGVRWEYDRRRAARAGRTRGSQDGSRTAPR